MVKFEINDVVNKNKKLVIQILRYRKAGTINYIYSEQMNSGIFCLQYSSTVKPTNTNTTSRNT